MTCKGWCRSNSCNRGECVGCGLDMKGCTPLGHLEEEEDAAEEQDTTEEDAAEEDAAEEDAAEEDTAAEEAEEEGGADE
eukprot:874163-Prymnesium_polylepis.1